MNLIFCELMSFLLLDASTEQERNMRPKMRRGPAVSVPKALSPQVDNVCDYIVKTLKGETPSNAASTPSPARPISAASYDSILPTVWALLNNASPTHVDLVLSAVIEHATKASSTSAVKGRTIEFVGRLVLVRTLSLQN